MRSQFRVALLLAGLLASSYARAEKVTVAKYRTTEKKSSVYAATIEAITHNRFTLRSTDKAQGTIQAYRAAWGGGGEFASVFITVEECGSDSCIEARFTRHSGIVGGGSPDKWASDLASELSRTIRDLTYEKERQ
jgi:hypothetical protein